MYYLNDDHYQYEYCLYIQKGRACPYINEIRYIHDLVGLQREIDSIERKHNQYHQRFYIDNDFYKNKYSLDLGGTYYKFLRRPVSDWEEFSLENL